MKSHDLKEIIRTVVKEELEKSLPSMIPSILTEILSGKSTQTVNEKVEKPKSIQKQTISSQNIETTPKKTFKKYTNNDVLNAVLNETVGGVPKEGSYVGLMGSLQSESSKGVIINESVNIPPPITPVNEEQSKVLNVINRDFRKLMKAVDKKKTSNSFGTNSVGM